MKLNKEQTMWVVVRDDNTIELNTLSPTLLGAVASASNGLTEHQLKCVGYSVQQVTVLITPHEI